MYKHVFTIQRSPYSGDLTIDAFCCHEWEQVSAAAVFSHLKEEPVDPFSSAMEEASGVELRSRYSNPIGSSPLVVNSDHAWSRDELELYVNTLDEDELRAFIKQAQI